MIASIGTSVAALGVASTRMKVAADNLANQHSVGYQPKKVVQTNEGGVPSASVEVVANPVQKYYLPDNPQADEYGFVNAPNVDQASELISARVAFYDYKASLIAIKVQNDAQKNLLDIFS